MFKIKNWNEFQHFKDRNPPWIKLYRENLYRRDIMSLSDRNFKILICLWMIASEDKDKDGNLPEISDIAYKLRMSESDINKALKDLRGFLDCDDINMISNRYQHDAPETETETETETEKRQKADFLIPDWINEKTWNDYLEMRKGIKKPATNRAKELIISKLEKFRNSGHDVEKILEQSILNNWQDIYELKQKGNINGKSKLKSEADELLEQIRAGKYS